MASCPACQGQQRSFRGYVATSQDPGGITPPPAAPRSGHNAARHGAFWYSISAGRRAPGHHPMAARWAGASRSCSLPRPRTRTGPSPSPGASRTTKNQPTGIRGIRQSGERSPRPEAHAGTCVLLMVQDLHIRVINADTGEHNRELVLNPEDP